MSRNWNELVELAHEMADAAAIETLRLFRAQDLGLKNKKQGGFDPVTQADRDAESAMRKLIEQHRPDDAVLGEEFGAKPGSSGVEWVLDPIDGTRAYMSGVPSWGTLIAANEGGVPKLGIIDQPHIGERFIGSEAGAFLRNAKGEISIRVRQGVSLNDAILFTTFPEIGSDEERTGFNAVRDRVQLTRYGIDCYAYALLAMGQIDLVIEAGLNAYDIQAPIAVIEAAGGRVTDWQGGLVYQGGRVLAAGDPKMHAEALEILKEY